MRVSREIYGYMGVSPKKDTFWSVPIIRIRTFLGLLILNSPDFGKLAYDARFLFKVWATGQWKIGECVIVFQFSVYMLSLSFLVSASSFSNQNPCVTNPMSILYISPMTDKKTMHHMAFS